MHTRTATPTCRQTHAHTRAELFRVLLFSSSLSSIVFKWVPHILYSAPAPSLPPSLPPLLMLILIPISIPVPCSFVCQSLMKCPMNCDPKIKAKLNARSRSLIDRKRCSTQLIHPKKKKEKKKGIPHIPRVPTVKFSLPWEVIKVGGADTKNSSNSATILSSNGLKGSQLSRWIVWTEGKVCTWVETVLKAL